MTNEKEPRTIPCVRGSSHRAMTAAAGMVTRTAASIILVESVALGCDVWATGNGKNVGPRGQVTQNPLGLRLVRAENQILQYW
jgi:hypothetical protein